MGNKPAGLVLARIDLEIFFRATEPKQDIGDGTIALAAKARVEGTQGQDVPLPKLRGQRAKISTWRVALERATKPSGGVRAQVVEIVYRQECSIECRCVGNSLRQPELMRNAIDLPDAMPAIGSLAQVEAVEMRKRDDRLRLAVVMLHGGEPYRPRLKAWAPEQGLPIG